MSITRARAFCRWSRAAPSLPSQKAKAFEQQSEEAVALHDEQKHLKDLKEALDASNPKKVAK